MDRKAFFAARYRELDSDELIDIQRKGNLLDEAAQAMEEVLSERGISVEQRRQIAKEMEVAAGDDKRLASLGDRFAGQFLDTLAALLLAGVVAVVLFKVNEELAISLAIVTWLGYTLFSDGFRNGQSLGKRMVGIAVVDARSRNPCGYFQSFIRNLPLIFLGILDWIFIMGEKRRRLGDMLASTDVVRVRKTREEPAPVA